MVPMTEASDIVGELWTAAQSAQADGYTMDACGVPSLILMERAALCVSREVAALVCNSPELERVLVLCGPGNNGGDGLAVARQLHGWGIAVAACLATAKRNKTAEAQLELCRIYGVEICEQLPEPAGPEVVIVDGLLGTGSRGAPRGAVAEALRWAEKCVGPKLAIDVPSGVVPDTGYVYEHAFRAGRTVTFKRSKSGLHVTPGRDFAGAVTVATIGLLRPPQQSQPPVRLIEPAFVAAISSREPAAHKGQRGHVGIVGGSAGTPGAAVLAGVAALRAGAGLATICSDDPEVARQLLATRPELMNVQQAVKPGVLAGASVLVVGPGLTSERAQQQLEGLYRDDPRPAVWDASALDFVPAGVADPRVLTPHPGEAARMLTRLSDGSWDSMRVQQNRLDAARQLAALTGAVVVLKGAGTVVAAGDRLWICVSGGPALATAGSGDCLAGLIGALLAAGCSPTDAACAGVHLHGLAGEIAEHARPGAVALDIANCIGQAMRDCDVHPRWPRLVRG